MTDKQSFIGRLKASLMARGFSEAVIQPHLARFDRFYDRMANDELAIAESLLDIESIADNIAQQIENGAIADAAIDAQTVSVPLVDVDNEPTTEAQIPAVTDEPDGYEVLEYSEDEEMVPYEEYVEEVTMQDEADTSTRLPDYVKEEKIQDTKMFWILLALSLPVTLPLALVGLSAFAAMWSALAALMIGAVAALVGAVCIGAGISLVGIIYGIVQLSEAVPVGLYEIGVGVIAVGITMIVGILIYNFAVRLVPMLFKLVWKLFGLTLDKLKQLFNFLRKESAKL